MKFVASSVFSLLISLVTVNSFAGGPEVQPSFWTMSIGAFGAIYGADFKYQPTFTVDFGTGPLSQSFTGYTQQFGYSAGGQLGVQYHIRRFYLGLGVSAQSNSRQGNNKWTSQLAGTIPFLIQNDFRINYNADVTGALGTDLTKHTHVYGKIGASYAQLKQRFTFNRFETVTVLQPVFQETMRKGIWGYVAGLGIAEDIGRCVSLFAEYDYYDYGKRNLNTLTNITPPILPGITDSYTQKVSIDAYTIRVGLDVNFAV